MAEVVVLAQRESLRLDTLLAVENLGEDWRCVPCARAEQVHARLQSGADILLLEPGPESLRLLEALQRRPPLAPPFVLGGFSHPALDGAVALPQADGLAAWLDARTQALPLLAQAQLPRLTPLAKALLRALEMPSGMGAWLFLPEMLAMITLHPALLRDLKGRLYPLCGARCGLSAGAVERRLRLSIEAAWSRSDLAALERFFGQSVDPERGKPTNREFLLRMRQSLARAAERICGECVEKRGDPLDIVHIGHYTVHNGYCPFWQRAAQGSVPGNGW